MFDCIADVTKAFNNDIVLSNVKITMLDGIDDVTQNQNGVEIVSKSNVMLIRPHKENCPSLWDWPSL